MTSPHSPRRRRLALLVAFVVAWAVIAGVALLVRKGPIENDLTRRAETALVRAGVNGTTVTYDGQDATVRGNLADPAVRDRAKAAVRSVNGTRTVRIASTAPAPATATPAPVPATPVPTTPVPTTSPPATTAPATPDPAATLTTVLAGRTVRFATDSAALTPADLALLARIPPALGADPAARLVLTGHTDATGSTTVNGPLSTARAQAVADYLAAHGIAADRLTVRGAGASSPAASNGTEAGRAANRRVEITATS